MDKFGKYSPNSVNKARIVESNSDRDITLIASVYSCNTKINSWIIDSGASQHMCNNKEMFLNLTDLSSSITVEIGDGRSLLAVGIGSVPLKLNLSDAVKNCTLEEVLFVPELSHNLLSISRVTKGGKITEFTETMCNIISDKTVVATGTKVGRLYYLDCCEVKFDQVESCNVSNNKLDQYLWHQRFCHLGINNLRKLVTKNLVTDMNCDFSKDSMFCEDCCNGKNYRYISISN